jgi:ketoreductase RED1
VQARSKFKKLMRDNGIARTAVVGGGVIGASWAALFLANGLSVIVNDPDATTATRVMATIEGARPVLSGLGYDTDRMTDGLSFETDLAAAVHSADLVQECGPERLDFKKQIWRAIEAAAPKHALLLSSSAGIPASAQSRDMIEPSRLILGHPFNPPYLMPLVEVVPSSVSNTGTVSRVLAFYRGLGKVAVELKREEPGFVADRLQAALFRESVSLVRDGVVSMRDLDDIVTSSIGIRWAANGPFLSFHLGRETDGLRHFIAHLSKSMETLWESFGDVSFDKSTNTLLIEQARHFYRDHAVSGPTELRDAREVAVLNAIASVNQTSDSQPEHRRDI